MFQQVAEIHDCPMLRGRPYRATVLKLALMMLSPSLSALLIELAISEGKLVVHLKARTGESRESSQAKGLIRNVPRPYPESDTYLKKFKFGFNLV